MCAKQHSTQFSPRSRWPLSTPVQRLEIALKAAELWPEEDYEPSPDPAPLRETILEMVQELTGVELGILLYVTSLLYLRQEELAARAGLAVREEE